MKPIQDYITKQYILPDQFNETNKWQTFEEFLDLNGIYEDNSTKRDVQEYFLRNYSVIGERYAESQANWIEVIMENLNSHDSIKLIGKLRENFGKWISEATETNPGKYKNNNIVVKLNDINPIVDIHSIADELPNGTKEGIEFQHIIDLYGYYLTYVEYDGDLFTITLEPFFSENMNDEIRKNGNKIWHVCSKEAAERIKKSGMFRPKVGKTPAQDSKTGYRYFPRRLFFIMSGDTIKETIDEIEAALKAKNLIKEEYSIFEIDLTYYLSSNWHHEKGIFWKDNAMEKSNLSIYTYNAIPFSWCKKEWNDIEDMKKTTVNEQT